jgi:hypothetical protein
MCGTDNLHMIILILYLQSNDVKEKQLVMPNVNEKLNKHNSQNNGYKNTNMEFPVHDVDIRVSDNVLK